MAYVLQVLEGRPADKMLRAAQFCLAVAEQHLTYVHFFSPTPYSPWRHLLSDDEQERLHALDVPVPSNHDALVRLVELEGAAQPDHAAQARQLAALPRAQVVVVEPGGTPPRMVPPGAWLVLLGLQAPPKDASLAAYARTFVLGDAAAVAGTETLPAFVDSIFLATEAQPPGAPAFDCLLIASDCLAQTDDFVGWLRAAGLTRLQLFDPHYTPADYLAAGYDAVAALPYLGAEPAATRAAAFATCQTAVVAATTQNLDDHFLWEAASCGVRPLAGGGPQYPPWSGVRVQAAVDAWRAAAPAAAMPTRLPTAGLGVALRRRLAAPAAVAPAASIALRLGPHRLRWFFSAVAFVAATPPQGSTTVVICPGEGAEQEQIWRCLGAYSEVVIDTGEHAGWLVGIAPHLRPGGDFSLASATTALPQRLAADTPRQLDLLCLGSSPALLAQLRRCIAGLQRDARAAPAGARLPRLGILASVDRRSGAPKAHLGAYVAGQELTRGLGAAAAGRATLSWMGRRGAGDERGRIYFYPYGERLGLDRDEVDLAQLPQLLRRDGLDALCGLDLFVSGAVGARALWAQRSMPIVSMLHSIHSAAGVTDAILQALGGASLACDAVVAPSACGRRSYLGLLEGIEDWLKAQMGAAAPRFAGSVEVIPYGIDGEPFAGLQRASCRAALGWPAEGCVLLVLGRLTPSEKADLLPLLLAFSQLLREFPTCRLVLAGGESQPGYAAHLQHVAAQLRCADRLEVRKNVSTHEKVLLLGGADVALGMADSLQETHGLGILEAMAASLPVVAAAWNGYAELVEHDRTGLLVPTLQAQVPADLAFVQRLVEGASGYGHRDQHEGVVMAPETLLQAMRTMCAHPERRLAMGAAGRARQASHFDFLTQADKLVDLLQAKVMHAKRLPWPPAQAQRPFIDPIGRRFAHYASAGFVDSAARLWPQVWLQREPALQQTWLSALALPSHGEQELVLAMIAAVQAQPGIRVDKLATDLQSPRVPAADVERRIARALKYGLLCLAPGAP